MADACRKKISDWWDLKRTGANAGLLHDRFLRVSVGDEEKKHPKARKDLFDAMCQSLVQSMEIYRATYERQVLSFKNLKSKGLFTNLKSKGGFTAGRLVIGLGGENVLETGLTLNHIYGTPMIPGTALKGLAAHYCDQAWGTAGTEGKPFKRGGEYHRAIFGTKEESGHIIFHDAWITPESLEGSLQPDVITPHHGDYYSGKTPPTDFDDPNPVSFLSVVGTFNIAVSCDVQGPDGDEWADRVFGLLSDALKEWGIGGKTNAGYGRLVKADLDKDLDKEGISELPTKKKDTRSNEKKPPIPPLSVTRIPRYKIGDVLEVTRIADPKENKGRLYFMADDGIGGPVTSGIAPSVEIGQKTHLKVKQAMKEGYYVFAALAPDGKGQHQKKVG